jgi:hypothetical protein
MGYDSLEDSCLERGAYLSSSAVRRPKWVPSLRLVAEYFEENFVVLSLKMRLAQT